LLTTQQVLWRYVREGYGLKGEDFEVAVQLCKLLRAVLVTRDAAPALVAKADEHRLASPP
jgi:hypothetical protein